MADAGTPDSPEGREPVSAYQEIFQAESDPKIPKIHFHDVIGAGSQVEVGLVLYRTDVPVGLLYMSIASAENLVKAITSLMTQAKEDADNEQQSVE